jgi:toxin YoeB
MYRIVFTAQASKEYSHWASSGNTKIIKKIFELLEDMAKHPYSGIGKPEALRYDLTGKWSRRINSEHRIVYSVREDTVEVYIISMKYHYSKK